MDKSTKHDDEQLRSPSEESFFNNCEACCYEIQRSNFPYKCMYEDVLHQYKVRLKKVQMELNDKELLISLLRDQNTKMESFCRGSSDEMRSLQLRYMKAVEELQDVKKQYERINEGENSKNKTNYQELKNLLNIEVEKWKTENRETQDKIDKMENSIQKLTELVSETFDQNKPQDMEPRFTNIEKLIEQQSDILKLLSSKVDENANAIILIDRHLRTTMEQLMQARNKSHISIMEAPELTKNKSEKMHSAVRITSKQKQAVIDDYTTETPPRLDSLEEEILDKRMVVPLEETPRPIDIDTEEDGDVKISIQIHRSPSSKASVHSERNLEKSHSSILEKSRSNLERIPEENEDSRGISADEKVTTEPAELKIHSSILKITISHPKTEEPQVEKTLPEPTKTKSTSSDPVDVGETQTEVKQYEKERESGVEEFIHNLLASCCKIPGAEFQILPGDAQGNKSTESTKLRIQATFPIANVDDVAYVINKLLPACCQKSKSQNEVPKTPILKNSVQEVVENLIEEGIFQPKVFKLLESSQREAHDHADLNRDMTKVSYHRSSSSTDMRMDKPLPTISKNELGNEKLIAEVDLEVRASSRGHLKKTTSALQDESIEKVVDKIVVSIQLKDDEEPVKEIIIETIPAISDSVDPPKVLGDTKIETKSAFQDSIYKVNPPKILGDNKIETKPAFPDSIYEVNPPKVLGDTKIETNPAFPDSIFEVNPPKVLGDTKIETSPAFPASKYDEKVTKSEESIEEVSKIIQIAESSISSQNQKDNEKGEVEKLISTLLEFLYIPLQEKSRIIAKELDDILLEIKQRRKYYAELADNYEEQIQKLGKPPEKGTMEADRYVSPRNSNHSYIIIEKLNEKFSMMKDQLDGTNLRIEDLTQKINTIKVQRNADSNFGNIGVEFTKQREENEKQGVLLKSLLDEVSRLQKNFCRCSEFMHRERMNLCSAARCPCRLDKMRKYLQHVQDAGTHSEKDPVYTVQMCFVSPFQGLQDCSDEASNMSERYSSESCMRELSSADLDRFRLNNTKSGGLVEGCREVENTSLAICSSSSKDEESRDEV